MDELPHSSACRPHTDAEQVSELQCKRFLTVGGKCGASPSLTCTVGEERAQRAWRARRRRRRWRRREGAKGRRLRGVRPGLHSGPGCGSHMREVQVQPGQLSPAPPGGTSGARLLHVGNERGSRHGTLSGPGHGLAERGLQNLGSVCCLDPYWLCDIGQEVTPLCVVNLHLPLTMGGTLG